MSTWAEQPLAEEPGGGIGNDGLTDEERAAGVAPMFEPPRVVDRGAKCSCERLDSTCKMHNPLG